MYWMLETKNGAPVSQRAGRAVIEVEDNGIGLPEDIRDRLTEPYVTTRAKGTGLGLAIVRKIMEDHGGELILEDRAGAARGVVFRRHGSAVRHSKIGLGPSPSAARLPNLVYWPSNDRRTMPVGPWRCLATINSARP